MNARAVIIPSIKSSHFVQRLLGLVRQPEAGEQAEVAQVAEIKIVG